MCATLTLNISKSALRALMGGGHFGWFDQEVAFEVRNQEGRGGMMGRSHVRLRAGNEGGEKGGGVLGGSPAVLPPPHPSLPHRVQVGMSFSSHVLAIVPAAVIGVFSGLLATAFTLLNLKVARLRDALTSHLK